MVFLPHIISGRRPGKKGVCRNVICHYFAISFACIEASLAHGGLTSMAPKISYQISKEKERVALPTSFCPECCHAYESWNALA
jgi:hypothetical protein